MIATRFIPLSLLSIVSTMVLWESGLERILCGVLVTRTQKSMNRCNGRRDITEILLKTALNTIQSINQSIKPA